MSEFHRRFLPHGIVASIVLGSLHLGCAPRNRDRGSLFTATAAAIEKRELTPARRRAALLGCISTNSLFVSSSFTTEISQGENIRLGHHAAGCYDALVRDMASDPEVSADERIAVALAAEKSVLAVDPDPLTRLERAARISEVAAAALKQKGDASAVDASLRQAWYAARASAPEVEESSSRLWSQVRSADEAFAQRQAAKAAAMNAALTQAVSSMHSAMVANANLSPAQQAQLQQQQQLQRLVTSTVMLVAHVSQQLAESRADLGVLLKSGLATLPAVLPEIEKRVVSLRGLAAAEDLIVTFEQVRRNEAGANQRLLARIAKSFGADLPAAPPPSATPPPETPSATPPPEAPSRTAVQRIGELKELLDKGLITASEFEEQKKRVLEEVVK